MYTVCPKCTLTLAVTAGDLRIGQGYVRCGRCSNVFNALLKLSEAPQDASTPAQRPQSAAPQADAATPSQITRAISAEAEAEEDLHREPAAEDEPTDEHPIVQAGSENDTDAESTGEIALSEASARESSPNALAQEEDDALGQFGRVLDALGVGDHSSTLDEVGERGSYALVSLDHITIETEVEMPTTELDHPIESIAPAGTQPLRPAASVAGTAPTATTAAAATTATIAVAPAAAPGAPGVYERLADSGELRIASAGSSADSSNARVQRPGGTRQIARDRLRGQGPAAVASAVSDGAELSAHAQAQLLESRGVDASLDLSIPGLEPRRASRWPWWVGSGTFAAALAFAALLAWRTPLSASPMLGPPLTHMYAALGLASTAQWNLSAYEVRQQGAEVDANDPQLIHVRFSLANHAARAQPTPLLRLTLLDRYGKRVAQRLLSPADYWPKGAAPMASLGSDQRIDTEVSVRDPNAASASFELDVCLRPTPGALRCAGDAD